MHARIAMLTGIIALSFGSSEFACGGSCYSQRVYRPVVHVPVHSAYGHRVQAPTRFRIAKPAPARLPAVPVPAPAPVQRAATPAVNPVPAATTVTPVSKVSASKEKKSDIDENPFSKLSNLELIELSGIRQIIEGRN